VIARAIVYWGDGYERRLGAGLRAAALDRPHQLDSGRRALRPAAGVDRGRLLGARAEAGAAASSSPTTPPAGVRQTRASPCDGPPRRRPLLRPRTDPVPADWGDRSAGLHHARRSPGAALQADGRGRAAANRAVVGRRDAGSWAWRRRAASDEAVGGRRHRESVPVARPDGTTSSTPADTAAGRRARTRPAWRARARCWGPTSRRRAAAARQRQLECPGGASIVNHSVRAGLPRLPRLSAPRSVTRREMLLDTLGWAPTAGRSSAPAKAQRGGPVGAGRRPGGTQGVSSTTSPSVRSSYGWQWPFDRRPHFALGHGLALSVRPGGDTATFLARTPAWPAYVATTEIERGALGRGVTARTGRPARGEGRTLGIALSASRIDVWRRDDGRRTYLQSGSAAARRARLRALRRAGRRDRHATGERGRRHVECADGATGVDGRHRRDPHRARRARSARRPSRALTCCASSPTRHERPPRSSALRRRGPDARGV